MTAAPLHVEPLAAGDATVPHDGRARLFYRHGWHSWSPAGWVDRHVPPRPVQPAWRRPQADDPVHAERVVHGSSGVGALLNDDGTVLLLGALGVGARVEVVDDALRGTCEGSAVPWMMARGEERAVFEAYAAALGARLGRARARCGAVWCSWYAWYRDIDENLLGRTLDDLGDDPVDVFQIDDGWQVDQGDWCANASFPTGMAAMARRIGDSGRVAGLWMAPFVARKGAALLDAHPDWMLRDDGGAPVAAAVHDGVPWFALDTTRPDVEAWLAERMTEMRAWGYDYLKLDYLYAAALPGRRHLDVPREEAYRRALGVLRAAAGDAYLLACGAPVIATLGLADGLRVGPDVAPLWDNPDRTELLADPTGPGGWNALRTSLHRLWLSPLVQTDPDVAYLRTRYNLLSDAHKALLADLGRVSGFRATSDPPAWLDAHERAAMRDFLGHAPHVLQRDAYRFDIDGRTVDFAPVAAGPRRR